MIEVGVKDTETTFRSIFHATVLTVTNNIVPMDVRNQQSQHHHSHYDRQYQFEETIIITTVSCRSDDARYERASSSSTARTLETTASYYR